MCSAEPVAWALQWKCPCERLADNELRLRAQSLREKMQVMSQDSRKQFVWSKIQKLAPSRPRARWRYTLFGANVCKRSWVRDRRDVCF